MSRRIGIIGAGLSGLTCASLLKGMDFQVSVYEKSRGPSGRMSTRRTHEGNSFDHGAQYFTARDPLFQTQVHDWIREGCAARWDARIVNLEEGQVLEDRSDRERFVGTPGMNAIGKHIAARLHVEYETRVDALTASASGWQLFNDSQSLLGEFEAVVVSAPSLQTAQLVEAEPTLSSRSRTATMQGCWSMMVAFEQSLQQTFGGAFIQNSPLSWISNNSSKPDRTLKPECWVLHASPEWTEQHIDDSTDSVENDLLDAFRMAVNIDCLPRYSVHTHRWRYAIPTDPLTERCLFSGERGLGVCGDWCGGPRVEGAFLSGHALANAIATELA